MAEIDLILPTLPEIAENFRDAWYARSYQADPTKPVDVGPGTIPYVASNVVADVVLPLYANHDKIARGSVVRGMTGDRLERRAREVLAENSDGSIRLPATGGSGYFEATKIATGGAYIEQGTVLLNQATGYKFQVVVSDTYADGDPLPIVGIDVGPDTNLDADTVLVFDSPPAGVSTGGLVLAQNDGTGNLVGLTGGREAETDEELQDRIIAAQSDPPAAGNRSELVIEAQRTGGVPVAKAFAISAWFGPGSVCLPFILREDASVTRIPNSTQRGLVQAQVANVFPTDYSITVPTVLAQNVDVHMSVTWSTGVKAWADTTPFPEYVVGDALHVDGTTSITSTYFRVTTTSDIATPQSGQTIALFDLTTKKFMRKRIDTVSVVVANRSWDLTFVTALGASDTFTPADGALVSPWSQSLVRLVQPLLDYMKTLGPGEQFATFPDPGGRQRRWPLSPESWPNIITNDGLVNAMKASRATSDSEVLSPATPHATTVGTPGVSVYLLQLDDFAVYPQT